jgi:hypothetical protein
MKRRNSSPGLLRERSQKTRAKEERMHFSKTKYEPLAHVFWKAAIVLTK